MRTIEAAIIGAVLFSIHPIDRLANRAEAQARQPIDPRIDELDEYRKSAGADAWTGAEIDRFVRLAFEIAEDAETNRRSSNMALTMCFSTVARIGEHEQSGLAQDRVMAAVIPERLSDEGLVYLFTDMRLPDRGERDADVAQLARYSAYCKEALKHEMRRELRALCLYLSAYHQILQDRHGLPLTRTERAEAVETLRELDRDHGDLVYPDSEGEPYSVLVERAVRSLESVRVSAIAPDTRGKTIRGDDLSLESYRGRVVVLGFWASWCAPCIAQLPHEIELSGKYSAEDVVFLGVNGDDTREAALSVVDAFSIPWDSFWNGAGGSRGPISDAWGVDYWPIFFVLDRDGSIYRRALTTSELEPAIDELIRE